MGVLSGPFAGVIFGVMAAVALGITALIIRRASSSGSGSADEAILIVVLVNTIVIIPGAIVFYYPDYGLTGRAVIAFILAGLVGSMLGKIAYFYSISTIGASHTEPLKASTPLFATILAVIFLGELVSGPHFFGIIAIIVGIAVISWESATVRLDAAARRLRIHGVVLALLAALLFGLEPIFAKVGFLEGTPALVGLALKFSAGTIALIVYEYQLGRASFGAAFRSPQRWWYVAAGVGNTLFLVSYYFGLFFAPVSVVVPLVQTSPLVVVLLSYLFLKHLERVTIPIVIGTLMVVVGAVIVTLAT